MNIQYYVIAAAAHQTFIQLYVNELADTLHMFNIECKYGGNKTLFLLLWDNKFLDLGNIQDWMEQNVH